MLYPDSEELGAQIKPVLIIQIRAAGDKDFLLSKTSQRLPVYYFLVVLESTWVYLKNRGLSKRLSATSRDSAVDDLELRDTKSLLTRGLKGDVDLLLQSSMGDIS